MWFSYTVSAEQAKAQLHVVTAAFPTATACPTIEAFPMSHSGMALCAPSMHSTALFPCF